MSTKRIEALENAVRRLTMTMVTTATMTSAQGIVCRAVADLLAEGGASLDDVRDRAADMAEIIGDEVVGAVRTILAAAPAKTGTMQ